MTQGRKPSPEPDDDRTLFDSAKEHSGLIAERTPPAGMPLAGAEHEPEHGHGRDSDAIGKHTSAAPALGASGTDHGSGLDDPPSGDLASSSGLPFDFDGAADLKPGQVLFDRYLVERQLGEGGMGTVWLVRHLEFDSERALKLIVSGIARDPQARARFRREARILDRLNHPNAVRVYDARLGKDVAFIEMEYVRGMSLNQLIVPGMPMALDWVLDLLEQLCGVLQAANDEGIIHRDLKPPNLMLVAGRQPGTKVLKLLDFGIAKIREGADDVRTLTGAFMGTPLYSSPEQITGEPVDARSDIYSVGLILYELLTGYRPFDGSINAIIYKHTMVPPPPFAEINPQANVPPAVEAVVHRCLAKDPDHRPQSPRELIELFREAAANSTQVDLGTGTVGPWPAGITSDLPQTVKATQPDAVAPPRPGRRRLLIGAALVLLALALAPLAIRLRERWDTTITDPGRDKGGRAAVAATGKETPRLRPGLAERIRAQKEVWGKQGYSVDPAGETTLEGWPKVLVRDGVRFTYNPKGLYLPPGYQLGREVDKSGHPTSLIRDDAFGVTFAWIAGGTFRMGSVRSLDLVEAGPEVQLSGFFMQTTEVTNKEIEPFIATLDPDACPDWKKRYESLNKRLKSEAESHPASQIPWRIAADYARRKGGRLPTEAQWEYAARSRGLKILHVWDDPDKDGEKPQRPANLSRIGPGDSVPVGRFDLDKTAQGLFDMTGNVAEWCRDMYKPYQPSDRPLLDPEWPPADFPTSDMTPMTVRGGSFYSELEQATTIYRGSREGQDVTSEIGFRIVIECPEIPPDAR